MFGYAIVAHQATWIGQKGAFEVFSVVKSTVPAYLNTTGEIGMLYLGDMVGQHRSSTVLVAASCNRQV